MERYSEYKDSGEQWLGEIPSHWEVRKAKYLWEETDVRSESGSEQLLSVSQYDGVKPSEEESRSESLDGYKIVKKDELVINIMLAWLGGLGVSSYEGLVSPAYCVYKLFDKQNPKYLHYLYKTPTYLAEFARRSTGIVPSRWRMYTDDFGQVLTLLPPLSEQSAIVAYLDRVTSQLDEAIAQQQRMIDLLNERKQIIIQHAVTKGLDPKAEMVESGVEWIGMMPKGWKICSLKHSASNNGKSFVDGDWIESSDISSEGIRYLTTGNIGNGFYKEQGSGFISEKTFKELNCTEIFPGDILISRLNEPIGRCCILPDIRFRIVTAVDNVIYRPKSNIAKEYIVYLMNCKGYAENASSIARGSTMHRISRTMLGNLKICIPPIEEQKKITSFLDSICIPINNEMLRREKTITLLRERKQIIINEVVTGKVKVS